MKRLLSPGEFFGHKQRTHAIPAGRFTEMVYAPSFTIPCHAHEHAFFGFVLEGGYTETYEKRQRECHPSSFLFHPEGEVHSEVHEEVVVRIFSIEPAASWFEKVRERSDHLRKPFDCQGGPMIRLATRLYREFQEQDSLTPIAMEGLTLELLATACREQAKSDAKPPRWLRLARELLHEQFTDDLSLEEIARTVGIHPAHLARAFRQHYRCTVGDYIRQLRMEKACQYLSQSEAALSEIALTLGYSDQSHFATAFKRHTGMTPGQFRKLTGSNLRGTVEEKRKSSTG